MALAPDPFDGEVERLIADPEYASELDERRARVARGEAVRLETFRSFVPLALVGLGLLTACGPSSAALASSIPSHVTAPDGSFSVVLPGQWVSITRPDIAAAAGRFPGSGELDLSPTLVPPGAANPAPLLSVVWVTSHFDYGPSPIAPPLAIREIDLDGSLVEFRVDDVQTAQGHARSLATNRDFGHTVLRSGRASRFSIACISPSTAPDDSLCTAILATWRWNVPG